MPYVLTQNSDVEFKKLQEISQLNSIGHRRETSVMQSCDFMSEEDILPAKLGESTEILDESSRVINSLSGKIKLIPSTHKVTDSLKELFKFGWMSGNNIRSSMKGIQINID